MIVACAVQFTLSATNAFGYVGRDSSVLQSATYPAIVHFIFGPLPIAMQSAFAFIALYWAARGWRVDLDGGRRLLRGLFLIVVVGLSLGISVIELYLLGAPHAYPSTTSLRSSWLWATSPSRWGGSGSTTVSSND